MGFSVSSFTHALCSVLPDYGPYNRGSPQGAATIALQDLAISFLLWSHTKMDMPGFPDLRTSPNLCIIADASGGWLSNFLSF